jgi:excisionase family DNA binding protein
MNPAWLPVVVVLGAPDDTLVASLGIVGLAPIAEGGEVVVWGRPRPSLPEASSRAPEPAPGARPPGLLMTIGDAALALGLGRSTVYELIGRGELEVVHVGRSARVPVDALRGFVQRRRDGHGVGRGSGVSS